MVAVAGAVVVAVGVGVVVVVVMISDDIKALRVQHSIPFLLREPLTRVLDTLEKRTEALEWIIESAGRLHANELANEPYVNLFHQSMNHEKVARQALEEK